MRAPELRGRGWLNSGGHDVSLADLRGKIVVLDFWTFCCINCLHVLDELRELEAAHRDVLVIVGVHSPKFVHEADPVALAAAVERYEVDHLVLDDPTLITWDAYAARAWPTLVVVDPEGYIVAHLAGEGHAASLAAIVADLIVEHESKGTLRRGDGPYVPPAVVPGTLRFPSKSITLPVADASADQASGGYLVADAGHHQLTQLAADGETLVRRIGSGERGLADGGPDEARFAEPAGLCWVPEQWRELLGYDVLVADTVNHALRGVNLATGRVRTVAGTGKQWTRTDPLPGLSSQPIAREESGTPTPEPALNPTSVPLSSPWDVVWDPQENFAVVAMAGIHQLWAFDPVGGKIGVLAGTTNEGLVDGPGREAWFAQPSGLALGEDSSVWLADSETSALRCIDWIDSNPEPIVTTLVGQGLFDFGAVDGVASDARLQHPLGVGVLPDGSVAIADTYNGAIRRYDPTSDAVTTLATGLAEPSDVWAETRDGVSSLVVIESAAHRLTRIPLDRETQAAVSGTAHRTARATTDIGPGRLDLDIAFTAPSGTKLDTTFGPATRVSVSATPPELIADGAGESTDLNRTLRLAEGIGEGVLHVTAMAACCDADPAVEYPACHVYQQDWGIPVRVVDGAPLTLTLPLLQA